MKVNNMSPEEKQLLEDLERRVNSLERAEHVGFIKSIERRIPFVTQTDLDRLTLNDLADVDTSGVTDAQVIKYTSSTQTWENANDLVA